MGNTIKSCRCSRSKQNFYLYRQARIASTLRTCSESSEGGVALEIGSHLGASSSYIAAGLKHSGNHLFRVDAWENETMPKGEKDTFLEFQKNTAGVKQQITTLRCRSEDINENDFKTPLNLVFIDGDHSYKAVKQDFELVQQ